MEYKLLISVCLLMLTADRPRSFVDTAPVKTSNGIFGDETVQELENLKQKLVELPMENKEIHYSKTQTFTEENGHRKGHQETREQVNKNGKVVAEIKQKVDLNQERGEAVPKTVSETEIDVPAKGIHKTIVKDDEEEQVTNNGERRNNQNEKLASYSKIEYSPSDMAEYIFWTGDEKGVTLAIEEFLQEGLMSKEEAINFLQDIKVNLEYIQKHYQRLMKAEDRLMAKERANVIQKTLFQEKYKNNLNMDYDMPIQSEYFDENPKQDSYEPPILSKLRNEEMIEKKEKKNNVLPDEDYEELVERLRVADFLYTEYSLEEVIYQLAKVMFTQSLTRGSTEAQRALQKFTNFLEKEAEDGHISRNLEKKILDVLIASLTDTLTEHPELVAAAKEGLGNIGESNRAENKLLKQLLLINSETSRAGEDSEGKPKQSNVPELRKEKKQSISKA